MTTSHVGGSRRLAFRGVAAGAFGMATGVVTFVWPSMTARALLFVIAAWALLQGVALIGIAVHVRKYVSDDWLLPLAGVLTALLGMVLLSDPSRGALAVRWAIGSFFCLYGVLELYLALLVHDEAS